MRFPLSRRAAASTALAGAALLLAACGSSADSSGHDMSSHDMASMGASGVPSAVASAMASAMPSMDASEMAAMGDGSTGDEGDIMFAQMMIPHHQQAVEMADIALAKPGASPFVRTLAEQIKAAQQPEIDEMTSWLSSWGATPAPMASGHDMSSHNEYGFDAASGGMPGMMSAKEMKQLERAKGAAFDRLWLRMMIAHHQGAITMAEEVQATTANDAVLALATAIATAQRSEIEQMQAELDR